MPDVSYDLSQIQFPQWTPPTPPLRGLGPRSPIQSQLDKGSEAAGRRRVVAGRLNDHPLQDSAEASAALLNEVLGIPGALRDVALEAMGTSTHEIGQYLPDMRGEYSVWRGDSPGNTPEMDYDPRDTVADLGTDPSIVGLPLVKGAKAAAGLAGEGMEAFAAAERAARGSLSGAQAARGGVVRFGTKNSDPKALRELRDLINTTKSLDETGEAATHLHGTPFPFTGRPSVASFGTGEGSNLYGPGVYTTTPLAGKLDFEQSGKVAKHYATIKNEISPDIWRTDDEILQEFPVGSEIPSNTFGIENWKDRWIGHNNDPGPPMKVLEHKINSYGELKTIVDDPQFGEVEISLRQRAYGKPASPNTQMYHAMTRQPFNTEQNYTSSEIQHILGPGWAHHANNSRVGDDLWDDLRYFAEEDIANHDNAHGVMWSNTDKMTKEIAADRIRQAGYDSIVYPGARLTTGATKHHAYMNFDPNNLIPAFPTPEQGERLLEVLLKGSDAKHPPVRGW